MKTLVVGYGNIVRGDDAAGVYAAEQLALKNLANVEVRTAHQLLPELIEDFPLYQKIYLIDCASEGPAYAIQKLERVDKAQVVSSHHVDPSLLMQLAGKFGLRCPEIYLCTLRGYQFEFDEKLSEETIQGVCGLIQTLSKEFGKKVCHA